MLMWQKRLVFCWAEETESPEGFLLLRWVLWFLGQVHCVWQQIQHNSRVPWPE
jgi:hypothetical protein